VTSKKNVDDYTKKKTDMNIPTSYIPFDRYWMFEKTTRECSEPGIKNNKEENKNQSLMTCRFQKFGDDDVARSSKECRKYFETYEEKSKKPLEAAALIGYVHWDDKYRDDANGHCLVYDPLGEM
jgi:hypothetical protein